MELAQLAVEKSVSAKPPPPLELPPLFVDSTVKLIRKYEDIDVIILVESYLNIYDQTIEFLNHLLLFLRRCAAARLFAFLLQRINIKASATEAMTVNNPIAAAIAIRYSASKRSSSTSYEMQER